MRFYSELRDNEPEDCIDIGVGHYSRAQLYSPLFLLSHVYNNCLICVEKEVEPQYNAIRNVFENRIVSNALVVLDRQATFYYFWRYFGIDFITIFKSETPSICISFDYISVLILSLSLSLRNNIFFNNLVTFR